MTFASGTGSKFMYNNGVLVYEIIDALFRTPLDSLSGEGYDHWQHFCFPGWRCNGVDSPSRDGPSPFRLIAFSVFATTCPPSTLR
eukprot:TRINITY_DN233_c0_g1_i1.p1 TRINITY_DN233_c0_g1~~TRINITY_DN233_c0_g1_i1.p1  ORF type:complete len:85 (-),score=8.78 TRINITY_DN233_c0_g1_i1:5-259(-)